MRIVVLADSNQSVKNMRKRCSASFYVETANQKILFDIGSNSTFAANAKKLSVDISKIDSVILSSGYADSGGGLKTFAALNQNASIYVQNDAKFPHYSSRLGVKLSCGIDSDLQDKENVVYTNNLYFLDDSIQLISNMIGEKFSIIGGTRYYVKENGAYVEDSFNHEQYMLIEEEGKSVLFLGNPYRGVANVIQKIEAISNTKVQYVFTGFQLLEEALKKEENAQQLNEAMKDLKEKNCHFYISKLNSKEALQELESNLKDQITYFSQGEEIIL